MRVQRQSAVFAVCSMRDQLFYLSPDNTTSLQSQLRELMVKAILDGHIPPGKPVPSCRQLARQLGVARNTVVLAYQQLVDQGYLLARQRSGYYVNKTILDGRVPTVRPTRSATGGVNGTPDWRRRLTTRVSHLRSLDKPNDWYRYTYPFIYGQCDPTLFPIADWRECVRQALSVRDVRAWARDRIDADDPQLIEQIHTRLLPRRGVWAAAEEILITNGAQQALYLLASLLIHPRDRVGLEDPGYPDARNVFALKTRHLRGLPVDTAGLVVDERLDGCGYVYVTPSHQSPTTVTMTLERRQALLAHASRSDCIVFEDDYESETNFAGEPTPALKSLDHSGRVLYVGSLSKTLAPGLRLGYLVGPSELIREARALRRLMMRHPPSNNQRAVALFLALGHHDALVQRLRNAYRERWQTLNDALERHLPDSARPPTFGGTSFWIRGPERLDSNLLARTAAGHGILLEPGDALFMADRPPRNYFRLGFSSIPLERIEPGIRLLAELIHAPCSR